MSKKISLTITTNDFIRSVNSGLIKINPDDLSFLKNQLNLKPKIENSTISLSNKDVENEFKTILNTYLLSLELC